MTTIYPRSDIRSIFNSFKEPTTLSSSSSSSSLLKVNSLDTAVKRDHKEKSTKVEKKTEVDCLADTYYRLVKSIFKNKKMSDLKKKIIMSGFDYEKIKGLLNKIIGDFKIRPKKLYRYFHYLKYNFEKKSTTIRPRLNHEITTRLNHEITEKLLEDLLENPFHLITFHNQFISYKDAMNICQENGTFPELNIRVKAWVYDYFIGKRNKYYISEYDLINNLLEEFSHEFTKEKSQAEKILSGILLEKKFGQQKFYTTLEFLEHEKMISDMVMELFYHEGNCENVGGIKNCELDKKIEQHIKNYIIKYKVEKGYPDFQFEPEQLEAIRKGCALKRGELLNITGPPGTGKSTIVNCIVNYKLDRGYNIAIMAPTGLAQQNLKKTCKYESIHDIKKQIIFSTLHRAINFTFVQQKQKEYSEDSSSFEPFYPNILIIDEASMIDLDLFYKLLKVCKEFNTSLILIGDINQLPPIGPGVPFESIINSEAFNTIRLNNIKRQHGNLREVIEKLNTPNGITLKDFDDPCSIFIEAKTSEQIEKAVIDIYRNELELDSNTEIHTMCPQKERGGGVFHLNPIIQKFKNGKSKELFVKKYENGHTHQFYEGDIVMRTENDYRDENNVRVNGDVGTIHEYKVETKKYGKDEYRYTVKYDDGEETNLSVEDIRDAFVPFYASTVHKMQGLQKSVVIFIVSPEHNFCLTNENSKKLVYTAISRCKSNFYVVGNTNLFAKSQQSKVNIYPTQFMKIFTEWEL